MARLISLSQDGAVMVGGGKTPFLHMWDLTSQQLVKAVELPEGVREVRQLLFPPHCWDGGMSKVCIATHL